MRLFSPHKYRSWLVSLLTAFVCLLSFASPLPAADLQHNEVVSSLPFEQPFGDLWQKSGITSWQLAIPLDARRLPPRPVSIRIGDAPNKILLGRNYLAITTARDEKIAIIHRKVNAKGAAILLETNGKGRFQAQIVSIANKRFADATPFIDLGYPGEHPTLKVDTQAKDAVKLDQVKAMVGNASPFRADKQKRDTTGISLCDAVPLFAIASQLLHTGCDSHYFYDKIGSMFSASPAKKGYTPVTDNFILPPVKPTTTKPIRPKGHSARLQRIVRGSGKYPILTAQAIKNTCLVPLSYITSPRKPRGHTAETNDCIFSSADIINIYTRAFGHSTRTWNQMHFDQVVHNVLHTGRVGMPGISHDDEIRLVSAIELQQAISDAMLEEHQRVLGGNLASPHEGWLSEVLFGHAQQAYGQYVQTVDTAQPGPSGLQRQVLTPQQLQEQGALGLYQIDVDDFVPSDIPKKLPRVYRNGQWQEDRESGFVTEVIANADMSDALRQEALNTVSAWSDTYRAAWNFFDSYSDSRNPRRQALVQVVQTGPLIAMHVELALRQILTSTPEQIHFAITRHRNRIVSIFVINDGPDDSDSDSDVSSEDEDLGWNVSYALTEPMSTIPVAPNQLSVYREGAVRGAGQFTLRAIVREAQERNIISVRAQVVTIPSALMFNKIGFNLIIPDND